MDGIGENWQDIDDDIEFFFHAPASQTEEMELIRRALFPDDLWELCDSINEEWPW